MSRGAGTTTSRYWGDDVTMQCQYANGWGMENEDGFGQVKAPCSDYEMGTREVGGGLPNGFGLYDVLGNVWELTADCWHETYAGAPVDGGTWEGGDCDRHVLRGGGFYTSPAGLRAAHRGSARTSFDFDRHSGPRSFFDQGFRIARVIEQPASSDGP